MEFKQLDKVLEACVADVQARVDDYIKNQNRIHTDKTTAVFSPLTDAQLRAMASEALAAHNVDIREEVLKAIVAEFPEKARSGPKPAPAPAPARAGKS